jgi:hypothetical protein
MGVVKNGNRFGNQGLVPELINGTMELSELPDGDLLILLSIVR